MTEAPQASAAPRTRKWMIAAGILLLLAIGGTYLELSASSEAEVFCRNARVGAPLAPLAEAARSTGEKRLRIIKADEVQVGFTGIPPFSRYLCVIEAERGIVKSARVQRLD